MTSLAFNVVDARPEPHAAVPTILMRVGVTEADGATVHALALRVQIRIEPQRRRYSPETMNDFTISEAMKLPPDAFNLVTQKS